MNINELGEDLEQQFGKPRNITEENVRFMLSLIKEEFNGTKVNVRQDHKKSLLPTVLIADDTLPYHHRPS